MQDKTFKFPMVQAVFDSDAEIWEEQMVNEVKDNLIYPYLPELRMSIDIELNKGMLLKHSDATGLNIKQREIETFFHVGDLEKNYYPQDDGAD